MLPRPQVAPADKATSESPVTASERRRPHQGGRVRPGPKIAHRYTAAGGVRWAEAAPRIRHGRLPVGKRPRAPRPPEHTVTLRRRLNGK